MTSDGEPIAGGNTTIIRNEYNGAVFCSMQPSQPTQEPNNPIRVFLSYARADDDPNYDDPQKSFMRRLFRHLVTAGFEVWWDRESLPSRELAFTTEIENAIRQSDKLLLVVGAGAVKSEYVRSEWQFAIEQCNPVLPALRNGDYGIIPPELSSFNAIDCRPERDEAAAFKDLVNRLQDDIIPLGKQYGLKALPKAYVARKKVFDACRNAICSDAINPTVISALPSAVALIGLGGIGKSTLANALAHDCQVRRYFPDGIIWLEVGKEYIPRQLQAAVGMHLGDSYELYQDDNLAKLRLSDHFHQKALLIILDDVWDYKVVEAFPISGTRCRLLITTRRTEIASLVEGADIRLETLSEQEGRELMTKRIGVDDPLYEQITRELGGHTLAISLAASQIANKYADSAAEMLRLIKKRQEGEDPFKDLQIDPNDKDKNLALSLFLSYEALDDDLSRRFRLVGIFPVNSMFDRQMLAHIWGDSDPDDARQPLQQLVNAGLIEP
ncbi:MAG: toll/interleukin-1 receptor domain-containing protein, partial [Chloroflexi bacterium]